MKETVIVTEKEIGDAARKIVNTLASIKGEDAKVLFLEGDLGAGKTTFTKEIAAVLGIQKEDVHSPTFILKKEYRATHPFFRTLIHIDAYRFDTKDEAKVLRLENDLKDKHALIVIEWPSKMNHKNPDMEIAFSFVDDDTRSLEVTL